MRKPKTQTDAIATPLEIESVIDAEPAGAKFHIIRFNKFNPDEKTYLKEYTFYNTFLPEYAISNATVFDSERATKILNDYANNIIEPEPNIEYQMQVVK